MIEFNCICRQYKFSVADDMAGGLIQCPTCRRLVDVPSLDELQKIDADGGYKFEGESTSKELDAPMAIRAYSSRRVDDFGEEIDLRNTADDMLRAGVAHTSGKHSGPGAVPPKYDAVTGELIRPLTIKNDTPRRVLPIHPESDEPLDAVPITPAKLSYSIVPPANLSVGGALLALLRPVNIIVMGFILLMHAIVHVTAFIVASGMIFLFIAPTILIMGLIGHYGNVIDEIGPSGHDELPTPLRNAGFIEDMWIPFAQVITSLFVAFLPYLISRDVMLPPGVSALVQLICLIAGCIAAPAIILTRVTSGTFLNLRPDRVASVILITGPGYAVTCIVFAAAGLAYIFGSELIGAATIKLLTFKGITAGFWLMGTGYAVLSGGIFLMHAVCWQLGLLYRTYHARFPWVLQRHVPTRMAERTRPRSHPGQLPPLPRG